MFLLDDLLLAPARGLCFIFREIHRVAEAERSDPAPVIQELQELYRRFETGEISDAEFTSREAELLGRLEQRGGGR